MNYLERFRKTQLLQTELDALSKSRKGVNSAEAERLRTELAELRNYATLSDEVAHRALMECVANGDFVLPTPEPYSKEAEATSPFMSFDELSYVSLSHDRVQRVIVESPEKGRLQRFADYPFVRELFGGIIGSLLTLFIQMLFT